MGEWHIEEVDGDNPIVWIDEHTYFVAEHDPSMIVNAHNADCAAYRAELARVKAESLRVVPDGDACKFDDVDTKFILHRGHIYGWHEIVYHEKSTTPIYGGDTINLRLSNRDTIVQPVRIERWEATDDNH